MEQSYFASFRKRQIIIYKNSNEVITINYQESINYIHSTPKFSRILGNDVLRILLDRLGNPHKNLKFIHLAGTNGKGSTASMIANILKCEGYKVGLYTSPFLEIFNDRIRINGENIPNDTLAQLVTEVKSHIDRMEQGPSEFALTTAVMFLYFYREKCDYVVLETGMGGKLDATNVIESNLVTVLTSVSLDHTQYLGDTIEKITAEKCGIIKPNSEVVCYCEQTDEALAVIKKFCQNTNSNLTVSPIPEITADGFIINGKKYPLALKGHYQPYNASNALTAINILQKRGIAISENSIINGLNTVSWSGRFEFLKPNLVIDGGHNPNGIDELKKSLLALNKRIILVMAMMQDKNYIECVRDIAPIAYKIYATQIDYPRCLSASELADTAKPYCDNTVIFENEKDAVLSALEFAQNDDIICVCGSLFLVGLIRNYFNKGEI